VKASGKIINVSSNLASLSSKIPHVDHQIIELLISSYNTVAKGEDMGYRMSKAALNMMTVVLSKEFEMNGEKVATLAINPGYVATRMTKGRYMDDMDECIAGIVNLIETADLNNTGKYYNWNGDIIPW
jgi:NAD(P)-dependent dehydrogenase (short-subunit alcohol dehydrogenase family)